MESALSKIARELEQGVWDSPYRHCLLLMGLPLPPRLKFWACNLKGVPTMINSYMTWDGVAYIGAIVLLAPLNPLTRN